MKFSAILFGTLAAFTTASAVPNNQHQDAARGLDFSQDLINKINDFPGQKDIKGIFICIKKDQTWKADYSQAKNGIVIFTDVSKQCCTKAQSAWKKYGTAWGRVFKASFNEPCDGGQLTDMSPENAGRLNNILGEGHK